MREGRKEGGREVAPCALRDGHRCGTVEKGWGERRGRESGTRNGNVDASIRHDHSWCRKKRTSDTRAHASGLAANSRKCKCNIL